MHSFSSPKPKGRVPKFKLSGALKDAVEDALDKSQAEVSRTRNLAAVRQFKMFVRELKLPDEYSCPAEEDLLCAYAASLRGTQAGSTVRAKISAIKGWHLRQGEYWRGGDKLKRVLKGVDQSTPASSHRVPRKPVTWDMLRVLHDDLDLNSGMDACVLALATMAMFGQLRLGEITPSSGNQSKIKDFSFPTIQNISGPTSVMGSRKIHLPKSKTSQNRGEDIILAKQKGRADPIKALLRHLKINKLHDCDLISTFRDEMGRRRIMTKKMFLSRCNNVWVGHGIERITGHSFRIGGTTFFLVMGIKPDVVKVLGRWKSDAFLRYWRSLDALASQHIENIQVQQHMRV